MIRTRRKYRIEEAPNVAPLSLLAEACRARAAGRTGWIDDLADELGVSSAALHWLMVGLGQRGQSTWPMRDHLGRLTGIRERTRGEKRAVKGSRNGLFLPGLTEQPMVLVTEGESDCAAALTLGFFAVGRPGCQGATDHLLRWVSARRGRDLVLVSDADVHGAGQAGAAALAEKLAPLCRSLRIVLPPGGAKDLRDAVRAGADRGALLHSIACAPLARPDVRSTRRVVR